MEVGVYILWTGLYEHIFEQANLEPRVVDKAGGVASDSNDFFKIFSKHMDAIMLKVEIEYLDIMTGEKGMDGWYCYFSQLGVLLY